MRKYETWEVIKMLKENSELQFELVSGAKLLHYLGSVAKGSNGYLHIYSSNGENAYALDLNKITGILIDGEWELIQQPIPFLEAAKAYSEGKTIRCEWEDSRYVYNPNSHTQLAQKYGYEFKSAVLNLGISTTEILQGRWYVENNNE